jgi:hypothetical protein
MKIKLLTLLLGALGTISSVHVNAHHSFAAEFDTNSPLRINGTVIKVDWTNPHTYIFLEVENEEGDFEEWGFEMGSPNGLMRRGWTRNTLEIGAEVIITGTRARDGSLKGNAQTVLIAETCQRLFAGTSQRDFDESSIDSELCQ